MCSVVVHTRVLSSDRLLCPISYLPSPSSTSPLFPYTTLFRSQYGGDFVLFVEPPSFDARIVNQYALFSVVARPDARLDAWIDRKSTCLNSSHVRISYAVFCLKKKKSLHLQCISDKCIYITQYY